MKGAASADKLRVLQADSERLKGLLDQKSALVKELESAIDALKGEVEGLNADLFRERSSKANQSAMLKSQSSSADELRERL